MPLLIYLLQLKSLRHDLRMAQQRILGQGLHRGVIPVHMNPINMIFQNPVADTVQCQSRPGSLGKMKFQHQLDAVLMKLPHQILELPHRIPGGRIGSLGSEIIGLRIAPVIHKLFLPIGGKAQRRPFLIPGLHLREFIDRHQLQLIDSQLLQVRDFLRDAREGSLRPHSRGRVLRKPSYMGRIDHYLGPGQLQRGVPLPVIFLKDRPSPQGPFPFGRFAPDLPAADHIRVRVSRHLSVNQIIILVFLHRKAFQNHRAQIPVAGRAAHGDRGRRLLLSPFIQQKAAPFSVRHRNRKANVISQLLYSKSVICPVFDAVPETLIQFSHSVPAFLLCSAVNTTSADVPEGNTYEYSQKLASPCTSTLFPYYEYTPIIAELCPLGKNTGHFLSIFQNIYFYENIPR